MYMQNFMPSPTGAQYQSPMSLYAHGGHTGHHPMHHEAEHLRQYGVGRDRVLAHINPAEASYLQHQHGMSINPHTGLPQFGLFDMLKSGASALGNAAMSAAPGLWAQYGQPLAQSALQNIDTRVQNALPGMAQSLGQKIGGQRFGEQLGQLGQSFGQNLSNQYGKFGGLAGQVLPRVNQAMGMQNQFPSQFPSIGRETPMNVARDVGRGMWADTGQQMTQNALQRADQGIGNQLGRVPGVGSSLQQAYGQTPGVSGYAMPRINQAINPQQLPQAFAHGGYVYNHPFPQGGAMHDMHEGGYQHRYPFVY
jgi:hypothetical protein